MFLLENRAVIKISGEDRVTFLQGLITNDVTKATSHSLLYGLMLNPQGRFLYDFFIQESADKLLLDVPKPYLEEIIKKFKMYKLRSQVEIAISPLKVYATSLPKPGFLQDPRCTTIGFRAMLESAADASEPFAIYEEQRIKNCLPDAEQDFFEDKSFPLEYGMDKLNAIDFNKGCYVGQEVTARTYHLGTIRKGLYRYYGPTVEKGMEITANSNKLGITLGKGLCLLRHEDLQTAQNQNHAIMVGNEVVTIIND
jgi:folate-binding protein YgfZ